MAAPQIFQLSVASGFSRLDPDQKLYAHYMSRAAWSGTRIILRQVSPEAISIFDFIIALYSCCNGDWDRLASQANLDFRDLQLFLDYAATFLSNIGNYYGSGDQKFTPSIPKEKLARLAACAPSGVSALWEQIRDPMFQKPPLSLGPPSKLTQSTYYLGYELENGDSSFWEDATLASEVMQELSILPENTRLRKERLSVETEVLSILQESVTETTSVYNDARGVVPRSKGIQIVTGDHKDELARINAYLQKALEYTCNQSQYESITRLQDSFTTGNLATYKESQSIWVTDKAPMVESVLGFVEPYRDPLGVRSEFEGIVGIPDAGETQTLKELSEVADSFVSKLPWVNGEGAFEKSHFEAPDFSSVQSLAYCSSIIFPGINLPNYNDIRQNTGYKNIIFSNRMLAESHRARGLYMVSKSEQKTFKQHRPHAYYIWVVLHEILGHGTGRFLTETTPDNFNFDPNSPPLNPITGDPVKTWYQPGQTWTGVFADLSTTVDECRAELVGAFLIDDLDILALFGYTQHGEIKPDDLVYNLYLQLGTDGLRGLENYDPATKKWSQAHSQAHYSILRHLLRDSKNLYTITCNPQTNELTIQINRTLIIPEGKTSLSRMLLRLHIYRCTADIASCREFYEDLSSIDDEALQWREIVIVNKDPPLVFSQANTFICDDGTVELREYEPTARGVIRGWAERDI
ncbi:peptidase family M49-domain-containing protein [Aspergillus cavernicola]|uniref:Dipeptidyl peptidase 3 n=1 Tax=Aspergillus cavernicola TaxID=176166 RepID=A0ABR4J2K7_9EURO